MSNFVTSIKLVFEDHFTNKFSQASKSIASMRSSFNKLGEESNFSRLAGQFSMMSMQMQGVSQGLKDYVNQPKQLMMNIQDSMASVNTVLLDSNAAHGSIKLSYDALKKSAIDWSKSHSDSAQKFIDTSYSMLSAGLNSKESIIGTQQAMLLAKGTLGDSTVAADLMAIVYNNMGKTLKDSSGNVLGMEASMTKIADTLAKTQGLFDITNLDQLNEGMKYGTPTALQYGVQLSQLSTVIGQLNTAGMKGSMAGTSFGSMMRNMVKASGDLNFKLAFNVEGDESSGLNVVNTLNNIKSKLGSIDFSEQLQLQKAFGDEGLRGLSLLLQNMDSLNNASKEVENSQGVAFDMASKKSDTLSEKMQILQNRKDALKLKTVELAQSSTKWGVSLSSAWLKVQETMIQNPVGQVLAKTSFNLANLGSGFVGVATQGITFAASSFSIAAALGKTSQLMGVLGNLGKFASLPFSFLKSGLLGAGKAMLGFGTSIWTATVAAGPIVWIIAGIAAAVVGLGVGAYLMIKHWDKVKAFFGNLGKGMKEGILSGVDGVKSVWNGFTGFMSSKFQSLQGFLNKIPTSLLVFVPFVGWAAILIKHWKPISGFFGSLWTGITGVFKSSVNFIWNTLLNNKGVQVFLATFFPIIGIPIMIIKNWGSIKSFFSSVWNGISSSFKSLWNSLSTTISSFGDMFKKPFLYFIFYANFAWTFVKGLFYIGISYLQKPFFLLDSLIAKVFTSLITNPKKFVSDTISLFTNLPGKIKAGFMGKWDSFWSGVTNNKYFKMITGLFDKFTAFTFLSGKKIDQTMAKGAGNDNSLFKTMWNKLFKVDELLPHSDAKTGPFSRLTESGSKIISTMSEGVQKEGSLNQAINKKFGDNSINEKIKTFSKDSIVEKIKTGVHLPDVGKRESVQYDSNHIKNNINTSNNNKSSSESNIVNHYNINVHVKHLVEKIAELENGAEFIKLLSALSGVTV